MATTLDTGPARVHDRAAVKRLRVPTPALVHDYLLVLRGAERTFEVIAGIWPEAPIYTLLYDEAGTHERFSSHPVRPSALQHLGVRQRYFRRLLPLFPPVADRLGGGRHDLVVSSSSAFAHRASAAPGGVHVCYCHSPFRYAWHERAVARAEVPRPLVPLLDRTLRWIRDSDALAARSVTQLIANSVITQRRIADFWHRDAPIVHPPVQVDRFHVGEPEDWFLCVGELVSHKHTDAALRAAARADVRMKVVGDGPRRRALEAEFGRRAEFLGRVSDAELRDLYARCRALVVPNVEEFGIVAVEAQASGRPVLAVDAGGTCETVVDGETGVCVDAGDEDALAEALASVDFDRFPVERIVRNAQRFSVESFRAAFTRRVEDAWNAR